jgi:DNA-binding MarR family transcriptional regulator
MQAWVQFLRAHAGVTETLDVELERERGMPLTWYDVLIQLQQASGRLRMRELASAILFSKSGLTRLIDRMERAGMVRRQACEEDARGMFAVITPAGRRALAKARPVHHRGVQQHFTRHLSSAEIRAIASGMAEIAHAHGGGDDP